MPARLITDDPLWNGTTVSKAAEFLCYCEVTVYKKRHSKLLVEAPNFGGGSELLRVRYASVDAARTLWKQSVQNQLKDDSNIVQMPKWFYLDQHCGQKVKEYQWDLPKNVVFWKDLPVGSVFRRILKSRNSSSAYYLKLQGTDFPVFLGNGTHPILVTRPSMSSLVFKPETLVKKEASCIVSWSRQGTVNRSELSTFEARATRAEEKLETLSVETAQYKRRAEELESKHKLLQETLH